ncbi:MAG: hypothetical protein PHY73_00855 [Candidatus Omnitrophica bacterium]|nr:hypothetical protein [Candidatus Omnitrophota bacterium]
MDCKEVKNKKKNEQFEIQFFEGVLEKSPNFIEALVALGDLYTKHGFYEKGLYVDQKLVRLKPDDPIILYNLACSYSLLGSLEKSFCVIQMAVARGYDEFDFMQKDSDLKNLRHYLPFKNFLCQLKSAKAKV